MGSMFVQAVSLVVCVWASLFATSQGLQCYFCDNEDDYATCLLANETCSKGELCKAIYYISGGLAGTYDAGCKPDNACSTQDETVGCPSTGDNTTANRCYYCCVTDNCNSKSPDDVDECSDWDQYNVTCVENSSCFNDIHPYTCECNAGYTGDPHVNCTLVPVDECALGTHNCDQHANCTDTETSYNCTCWDGWVGDGFHCTDINECAEETDDCGANTDCTNTPGSFTCPCRACYIDYGSGCVQENYCDNDPCVHGTCHPIDCDFYCQCNIITGMQCEAEYSVG